jgi:hypothetical protein
MAVLISHGFPECGLPDPILPLTGDHRGRGSASATGILGGSYAELFELQAAA